MKFLTLTTLHASPFFEDASCIRKTQISEPEKAASHEDRRKGGKEKSGTEIVKGFKCV